MKKGTLFKILTLFLTFVIFSCCSGCLTLIFYLEEKERDETVQEQIEKKALADAFIPEIEGYIFEALPPHAFDNPEDIENQGFIYFWDFIKDEYYCIREENSENIEEYWFYPSKVDIQSVIKLDALGYVIPNEYHKEIFELFPDSFSHPVIEYDGDFYYLRRMNSILKNGHGGAGALALFLLDFQNHSMYYVGYSKGWLEYEIEHKIFYIESLCYYRIIKK